MTYLRTNFVRTDFAESGFYASSIALALPFARLGKLRSFILFLPFSPPCFRHSFSSFLFQFLPHSFSKASHNFPLPFCCSESAQKLGDSLGQSMFPSPSCSRAVGPQWSAVVRSGPRSIRRVHGHQHASGSRRSMSLPGH